METSDTSENKYPFKLFLRVRPQKDGNMNLIDYYSATNSTQFKIVVPEDSVTYKKGRLEADFDFSDIFLPTSTQERVFDATTKILLDGFVMGSSCLVMAYGVTGSGKTYTVLGPENNQGLVPRALQYIINGINSDAFKTKYKGELDTISLEMSFLEDYQNNIYDLLSPSTRVGQTKPSLTARADAQGVLHVVNLTEKRITSLQEGMSLIDTGTKEKHMAETKMNLDSSRSHTMCTFSLIRTHGFSRDVISQCRIVDLAGSERVSRTGAAGERTQEAGAINTDLMYLMLCLRSLVDVTKSKERIMYRNCKLTHLLSVGGVI